MGKIKHLDCFAGIGGFALALQQAVGKDNCQHIGYSEIDKFAKQVYKRHFPESKDLGDITKLDIDKLEDFDLLTGGYPCQDVSLAGKQNLNGGRTILVEYLLQILEKKQPKYFVFENVKGFMGKKFTTFRESIFNRIKQAGYNFDYKILNTKNFGLPQNRERVFIVGTLGKNDFKFPEGQELNIFLKDILEEKVDEKYYMTTTKYKNLNLHRLKEIYNKSIQYKQLKINLKDPEFSSFNQDNIFIGKDDITPTLTASDGGYRPKMYDFDNMIIRKLTPTECGRLQGFSDDWNDNMSNRQRYKQYGNAISIPVVVAIFNNLFKTKDTIKPRIEHQFR